MAGQAAMVPPPDFFLFCRALALPLLAGLRMTIGRKSEDRPMSSEEIPRDDPDFPRLPLDPWPKRDTPVGAFAPGIRLPGSPMFS